MPDEQVTKGSAGPARRQRRRRRGVAVEVLAEMRNLDERERSIGRKRKAMGPEVPRERRRTILAEEEVGTPESEPTDPRPMQEPESVE